MIKIGFAGVWVHDQDEALRFYTGKLGWELRADVTLPELGGYRWLTVGPPGQTDVSLLLNAIPGPPVLDAATADQIGASWRRGGRERPAHDDDARPRTRSSRREGSSSPSRLRSDPTASTPRSAIPPATSSA
jgi:catechol 2,3-dioxygenase-like lactoylglutathione lyase family enzyme